METRDPSETFGGRVSGTIASYDSHRLYTDFDTGVLFGNTRAYISVAQLDTHLWPHEGQTPAGLEQFHVEAKSVTDLGAAKLTLRVSHDESDDDPVIEATRAFIEQTHYSVDGSSATFNGDNDGANEYWADEWAATPLGQIAADPLRKSTEGDAMAGPANPANLLEPQTVLAKISIKIQRSSLQSIFWLQRTEPPGSHESPIILLIFIVKWRARNDSNVRPSDS